MDSSPHRTTPIRIFAACVAALSWATLLLQLYLSLQMSIRSGQGAAHGLWMYLAFFTVLTNLLVAVTLTIPLLAPRTRWGNLFARPETINGVTVNIMLVGIAYNVLLRNSWSPQGAQWLADELLHDVMPLLFVAYAWVLSHERIGAFVPRLVWAIWPIAFFLYALLRGAVSGFYPYPFINVAYLGYGRVLINALAILAGYFVLSALWYWLERSAVRVNGRARRMQPQ